jgi:hypothetical protein
MKLILATTAVCVRVPDCLAGCAANPNAPTPRRPS